MSNASITADFLERILLDEYGYSARAASVTANDLLRLLAPGHGDLSYAVAAWAHDRSQTPTASSGRFTTDSLARAGLSYPAALVFIDWHRSDPQAAEGALAARM